MTTAVNGGRHRTRGVTGLLRSYGPLAAAAIAFVVMAAFVEPLPRIQRTVAAAPTEQELGDVGTGSLDNPTGSTVPGQVAAPTRVGARPRGSAPPGATPCTDRARQVPGDPYSPPCYAFSGNNGGTTSRGVSSNDIIVTARQLEGPSAAEIFASISGESVDNSEENVKDTIQAIADYFNTHFQMYGRKMRIEYFNGEGNGASELLGGGKEKALADAIRAAKEKGAFADISGLTIPYADALARNKVVNIGAPYPSRKWFVDHRPYAWSLFPDGTNVVEAHSSWITSRLVGRPVEFSGPEFIGRPRKYAVVAPENAEYQESVNAYIAKVAGAGFNIALNMKYKLDINTMPNQASNIIAQLKDAGITSILCGCDPVMLAIGLTPKANEQNYQPEWITAGLAFVEQDIVSQLIDKTQWQHSFGIAYNAESEPQGRSFPHAAYKTMRPNDEPAFGVEEVYYQFYMLAIGIQMAGPNLTPESFEQGMFAYPGGSGPRGGWGFGPGDYTPMDDFREIWWDPNRISPQNNKPGAWVQLNNGARYRKGTVPHEGAPFFKAG
ncbi:MAG TPA: ABC transporter substrate-binding protein [Acidimicrobiales bacterium]|nr:ABC transporter substrate-binding protein [Acidimicrobiales bacterium]